MAKQNWTLNLRNIFLVCLGILALLFAGCGSTSQGIGHNGKVRIVTSFYPMYIDVLNITSGVDGVEVVNMTPPQTGCLHDYQLTTDDMKTLESADIFVVNGAGMETFLDKVKKQYPKLKIVEASDYDDIKLLKDGDEDNPHVWLSVTYSIDQVKAITAQLCADDPQHADAYRDNAMAYVTKLSKLRDEMHAALDDLPHKDIVTFHEAFPYLAKEFRLHIIDVIEHEPGTAPTPQEIEETVAKLRDLPVKVLFTEPQYSPSAAEIIARECGAQIYTLDPVVTGEATPEAKDAYIDTMRKNMETLQKALQ